MNSAFSGRSARGVYWRTDSIGVAFLKSQVFSSAHETPTQYLPVPVRASSSLVMAFSATANSRNLNYCDSPSLVW